MENQASPAAEERRSSARVKDRFPLFVRGLDAFDSPFSEMTEINDISQGGISFFMQSPVWVDSVVNVSISYLEPEETHPIHKRGPKTTVCRANGVDMGPSCAVA